MRRCAFRPSARWWLLVVVLAVVGCAPPEAAHDSGPLLTAPALTEPARTAVGVAEYERLLAGEAGAPLTLARMAAAADRAYLSIEEHMDALAVALGHGDWRGVFERLRGEHPPDVESLLQLYRDEVDRAAAFVESRNLLTLPPTRLEVVEAGNELIRRSFPLALYLDGQLGVTTSSTREPDPSYLVNHCYVCVPPLAVHEAYPGHHVSFWWLDELEGESYPSEEVRALVEANTRNMVFLEGWALYAELLMIEQGYYEGEPERELGAWRSLLHRALRARIDPRLHAGELGVEEAVELYRRELLLTEEAARTEVRRHLDQPTNKISYFIGLMQILELRQALAERAAATGEVLDSKEFHDRLLRWPMPVPEAAERVFEIRLASDPQWPAAELVPRVATAG